MLKLKLGILREKNLQFNLKKKAKPSNLIRPKYKYLCSSGQAGAFHQSQACLTHALLNLPEDLNSELSMHYLNFIDVQGILTFGPSSLLVNTLHGNSPSALTTAHIE